MPNYFEFFHQQNHVMCTAYFSAVPLGPQNIRTKNTTPTKQFQGFGGLGFICWTWNSLRKVFFVGVCRVYPDISP